MSYIFFFDTETTSSNPEVARVVEIALYFFAGSGCDNRWEKIEERCNPQSKMEIGAIATHHITPEIVQDLPRFADTKSAVWLRENSDAIAVAHNAPYDVQVLANEEISIYEYIDTLKVAKHILQDPNIESYSLQYLRYFYNLDSYSMENELPATMAHSAFYDTVVVKWLFDFLKEKVHKIYVGKDPIAEMVRLSRTPVILKTIPFGKYKGKEFSWIETHDSGYLAWLENASDDADIVATCRHYLEL